MLDGPVDPATAALLAERSQGNALFIRELVEGALDDGSLRADDGIWRLVGEIAPSARLVEIVEARLGRLDPDERALLELVAYGEPLGQAELTTLSDLGIAEALERRGLLASHLDGRRLQVRLAHPLYGDVVRARTPAVRARAIAESLAGAVEQAGTARHEDALRVATWRLTAGDGDPRLLLEGATIARWRDDFPLAERLARAAADAGAGFDADLLAAHVTGLLGRPDDADAELAELEERVDDDAERSRVAIARFDTSAVWTAVDDDDVLGTALAAVADPTWRDRLEARRLAVVLNAEGPRAAVDAAGPVLARAEGEALAFASLVAAYGLARCGRIDEALALSAEGAAARREVDSPLAWPEWWHAVTGCMALLYAGRFDEATAMAGDEHRDAVAEGVTEAQAMFALLEATAAADRGRVRTAGRRAREALAVHQALDRPVLVRQDLIVSAMAAALTGDAAAASADLAELDALGLPPVRRDEVDLLGARGWTAAAAGDLPGRAPTSSARPRWAPRSATPSARPPRCTASPVWVGPATCASGWRRSPPRWAASSCRPASPTPRRWPQATPSRSTRSPPGSRTWAPTCWPPRPPPTPRSPSAGPAIRGARPPPSAGPATSRRRPRTRSPPRCRASRPGRC